MREITCHVDGMIKASSIYKATRKLNCIVYLSVLIVFGQKRKRSHLYIKRLKRQSHLK